MQRLRPLRSPGGIAWFLPLLLALLLADTGLVRSAVTWQGLWAESDDEAITLTWETGTEFDNLGFYVLRAQRESGPFARRDGSWTLAQGGMIGSTYRWTDRDLRPGQAYFYLVESISQSNEVERHGRNGEPVCARLGGVACVPAAAESATAAPGPRASATRDAAPIATAPPSSPTDAGPTPVRVPTGAGGDDYRGGREPSSTAAPSRTRRGGSEPSSGPTERPSASRSGSRGRLVTAPARAGAGKTTTGTPARLEARVGTPVGGKTDGQAADRSRDDIANAANGSARQGDAETAPDAADHRGPVQHSGEPATDAADGSADARSTDAGTTTTNRWFLLLLTALALGLGLRVRNLARVG